jgi:hypothetical protein
MLDFTGKVLVMSGANGTIKRATPRPSSTMAQAWC